MLSCRIIYSRIVCSILLLVEEIEAQSLWESLLVRDGEDRGAPRKGAGGLSLEGVVS